MCVIAFDAAKILVYGLEGIAVGVINSISRNVALGFFQDVRFFFHFADEVRCGIPEVVHLFHDLLDVEVLALERGHFVGASDNVAVDQVVSIRVAATRIIYVMVLREILEVYIDLSRIRMARPHDVAGFTDEHCMRKAFDAILLARIRSVQQVVLDLVPIVFGDQLIK